MGRRDALVGISAFAIAGAFYLLLAGQLSATELIAAAPVALTASGFTVALRHERTRPMQIGARAASVAVRGSSALLSDAVRVGGVLAHAIFRRPADSAGFFMHQPFRRGGDSARDAGRRGVVILGLSLAPNGFVVGDTEDGSLIVHRLAPAKTSRNDEWPP